MGRREEGLGRGPLNYEFVGLFVYGVVMGDEFWFQSFLRMNIDICSTYRMACTLDSVY